MVEKYRAYTKSNHFKFNSCSQGCLPCTLYLETEKHNGGSATYEFYPQLHLTMFGNLRQILIRTSRIILRKFCCYVEWGGGRGYRVFKIANFRKLLQYAAKPKLHLAETFLYNSIRFAKLFMCKFSSSERINIGMGIEYAEF